MMNQVAEPGASYGGSWTIEKLNILENYLDAYTTALKKIPFKLLYIDAFAGKGYVELDHNDQDTKSFIHGSATRAIRIDNRPFDKLIFVEKQQARCDELKKLREKHRDRDIQIEHSDANKFLRNLQQNWNQWRGVLFLDPFGTDVKWSTIEAIADFNALDTWILFPTGAIARMLPRFQKPDDISRQWANRLTQVFGNKDWQNLYQKSTQRDMFEDMHRDPQVERDPGVDNFIRIYKEQLKTLLGKRMLEKSRTLTNSKNAPLFEFMFFAGNPKGIGPATKIAKHILEHM